MRPQTASILIILGVLAYSSMLITGCGKSSDNKQQLKATVLSATDLSCHQVVLDFSEDSAKIRMQTGKKDLKFFVFKLPETYRTTGQKLLVTVRNTNPTPFLVCNDLEPALSMLDIVSAARRN